MAPDTAPKEIDQRNRLLSFFWRDGTDALQNLFGLPAGEPLITTFSAALHREILQQGRLYVSPQYACFYSPIFNKREIIPFRRVAEIRKEKTAFVFPNAVQLVLDDGERVTFASLVSRETTYRCLFEAWQTVMSQLQVGDDVVDAAAGIPEGGDAVPVVAAQLPPQPPSVTAALPLASMGPEAAATAAAMRAAPIAVNFAAPGSGKNKKGGNSTAPSVVATATAAATVAAAAGTATVDNAGGQAAAAVTCGCTDHFGRVMFEGELPCSVDRAHALIFGDGFSAFFRAFYHDRKTTHLGGEPWHVGERGRVRNIHYTLPLSNAIGPRSAGALELQAEEAAQPGVRYIMRTEVATPKVPYGDKFFTVSRYCFTAAGPAACRLRVACEVRYPNGSLWAMTKSLIERSAYTSLLEYFTALGAALSAHVLAHPPEAVPGATAHGGGGGTAAVAGVGSPLPVREAAEAVVKAVEAEAAVVVAAAQAELRGPTWITLVVVALTCLVLGGLMARAALAPPPGRDIAGLTDCDVGGYDDQALRGLVQELQAVVRRQAAALAAVRSALGDLEK